MLLRHRYSPRIRPLFEDRVSRYAPCSGTPNVTDGGNIVASVVQAGATNSVTSGLYHRFTNPIRYFEAVFPTWYGSGTNGEVPIANDVTYRCTIKDIGGVGQPIYRFLFTGNTSSILVPANTGGAPFSLPLDVLRYISEAIIYCNILVPLSTDKMPGGSRILSNTGNEGVGANYAALNEGTAVGDTTGTGIVSGGVNGSQKAYTPIVLGYGSQLAVASLGDSIQLGTGSDISYRQGSGGPTLYALGGINQGIAYDPSQTPLAGIVKVEKGGETLTDMLTTYSKRLALIGLLNLDAVVCNTGTNDVRNGRLVTDMQNDTITVTNQITNLGVKVIWIPQLPETTVTDFDQWTTVVNQTVAHQTNRLAMKEWIISDYKHACAIPSMVDYWIAGNGVACNDDGSENPIGDYWKPINIAGPISTFSITSGVTGSSFVDTSLIGKANNLFRGYSIMFLTAANAANKRQLTNCRYNRLANGTIGGDIFAAMPSIGDTGQFVLAYTRDGLHPTAYACSQIALNRRDLLNKVRGTI